MTRAQLPLRWGEASLPQAPRSLLLVQISAMGDQVQTLPAVSDIAARWPGIAIDWAVDARFADIPRLHPAVRRVFALPLKAVQNAPASAAAWRRLLAQLRALRAQTYDLVWDPHSVLKSAIVARLAKSPLRVGYRAQDCGGEPLAALAYRLHFARPLSMHGTEGRRVFAQAVLDTDLARPIDYAIDQRFPYQHDPAAPPTVFLAHGASKPEKLWPLGHWQQLAARLVEQGLRLQVAWGNAAERERAQRIIEGLPTGAAQILDRRGLLDMLHIIAQCRLVIGVDTGFTHMAAALRRPVVGLFVSTGPELFTPTSPAIARALGGNSVTPSVDAAWNAAHELLV
ncbi:putative Lipopolysaccharide heptosyltransferase I [Thiomonas sp. X19]|uniref:lipopolysaccharide heptosyltransferase I n=1 Tax=Thiomonas sp. X19 TaxID=1050370 RepID=UPI000B65BD96|nr:lipopolysaccharide heptosyltransferase I [Thiomonas sp. X19]SCC92346.1 putative Lipopolysaccharide heptosyltransferase I [Thiomonas sp. X19]